MNGIISEWWWNVDNYWVIGTAKFTETKRSQDYKNNWIEWHEAHVTGIDKPNMTQCNKRFFALVPLLRGGSRMVFYMYNSTHLPVWEHVRSCHKLCVKSWDCSLTISLFLLSQALFAENLLLFLLSRTRLAANSPSLCSFFHIRDFIFLGFMSCILI